MLEQCRYYKIDKYFDDILGIDNIHAGGKVDIAIDFMKKTGIDPTEAMFVGDTLHYLEVAGAMGVKCILVSCGHQSLDVLKKSNTVIIDNISVLRSSFDDLFN